MNEVENTRKLCPRKNLREMAVRLLVLTVVAHALLAAHGQSGSGSAEDTCNAPDPRPNPPDLRNVDAAVMESRCHLVCVERVSRNVGRCE